MAFHRGNGGEVFVGAAPGTSLPVGKWTLRKSAALANVTNSTTGGRKRRHATVKDDEVTLECPWDDAVNPQANTFAEGDIIRVVLEIGNSPKKWTCAEVIIESVEYVDDQDEDVVRTVIKGYANDNNGFVYS
jgi:hypothetical protein